MAKKATDIKKFFEELEKHKRKAEQMGMNRAMNKVKTEIARIIRAKYNVRLKDVNDQIVMKKMNSRDRRASMFVKQKAVSLINFGARLTSKGVTYSIVKGKRELMNKAFIHAMNNGGKQVYRRVGQAVARKIKKGRYEGKVLKRELVKKMSGYSVAQMFIGKAGTDMNKIVKEMFAKYSGIEISRALAVLRRGNKA